MTGFHTLENVDYVTHLPETSSFNHLHELVKPHLDSFNSIFDDGLLDLAVCAIEPRYMVDASGNTLKIWVESVTVAKPLMSDKDEYSRNRKMLPAQCRERGISYKSKMSAKLCWSLNNGPISFEWKAIGLLPIMVRSVKCHLEGLGPQALVNVSEEAEELGGYFIVNGNEKLLRLLILPRRNMVTALIRSSFMKRGALYTSYGTSIRCVSSDQTSQTIALLYQSDGNVMVKFSYRKNEYLVPFVLIAKALINTNDREIFNSIVQADSDDVFLNGRAEILLREFKTFAIFTQEQCRSYLGSKFQVVLDMPPHCSEIDAGTALLRRIIFIHLNSDADKFNLLIFMIRKLYALVSGKCAADNADSPMNHEILLPGHLYLGLLKDKIDSYLGAIKLQVVTEQRIRPHSVNFVDSTFFKKICAKVPSDIGKKMEYFLATGNLISASGLDLQQTTGYSVIAEKLNYLRYLSHFRSVHRGAFFAELKTTTVRKLLPESWGFFCPVHTPDGAPCGLLNHLTHVCRVVTQPAICTNSIIEASIELGLISFCRNICMKKDSLYVILNGQILGILDASDARSFVSKLRMLKAESHLPAQLEIAYIPPFEKGLYPGVYLFTTPSRLVRPVFNLAVAKTENIGTLEQVFMDISVSADEIIPDVTTHMEIAKTNILSVVANLIPFPDHNQSPRNMYQCQMGKQTMGTPMTNYPYRTDNKSYRIYTPQTPLVRPIMHERYAMDHFPNGTNAIVAVISYTGYDMEDAMIINKSSYERGFAHGAVYKSEFVEIANGRKSNTVSKTYGVSGRDSARMDEDGLPQVGTKVTQGDSLYSVVDQVTQKSHITRYKSNEDAFIDTVRVIGEEESNNPCQKVHIKYRIPRNPQIGDKFSSRHGQKGVCSFLWPAEDMPFSEFGISPDVIINPHAFPSRMTIGMFVESMAGKAAAHYGINQDATAFQFSEAHTAADYFGEQLVAAGFNFHGNEPMYSGIYGCEFKVDIYIGSVYYQRLRHMVNDKFQVRTTGPVHALTQQPVKGRKRAGGIRFGEMERDSILAHGTAFLLQDRLLNCSDYSKALVCGSCGSIISTMNISKSSIAKRKSFCRLCKSDAYVDIIALPYVFRYLAAELTAMNINIKLTVG